MQDEQRNVKLDGWKLLGSENGAQDVSEFLPAMPMDLVRESLIEAALYAEYGLEVPEGAVVLVLTCRVTRVVVVVAGNSPGETFPAIKCKTGGESLAGYDIDMYTVDQTYWTAEREVGTSLVIDALYGWFGEYVPRDAVVYYGYTAKGVWVSAGEDAEIAKDVWLYTLPLRLKGLEATQSRVVNLVGIVAAMGI